MSFRNPPTARTLGLTNKVSTFVGPSTDPPQNPELGDLWYVTDFGNVTSRWNGSGWVDFPVSDEAITQITGSMIRTAASGQRWELSSGWANTLKGITSGPGEVDITTFFDGISDVLMLGFPGSEEQIKITSDGGPGNAPVFTHNAHHLTRIGLHNFVGKANVSDGLALGVGRRVQSVDGGFDSGTTGPAGRRSITHILATVPDAVMVVPCNSNGYIRVDDTTMTTNSFEVEYRDNANVIMGAGVSRKVFWVALDFVPV